MTRFEREDALTMADLVRSTTLRTYLSNVRDWHGYIRFLGLPDRRDNPDVVIDRLFVEPLVTRQHVSPDEDPENWLDDAEKIFDVLKLGKPIVLLGDPGSGKSTLLNYLVWLLARPTVDAWARRMGPWLLPVPMQLRELRLHDVTDFSGLLKAFLQHGMSRPLRRGKYLAGMLEQGRVLILLDGIDEVASLEARKKVREAVFDGIARYPQCRWVLSSRIVGYDEVPFDSGSRNAEWRMLAEGSRRRGKGIARAHHRMRVMHRGEVFRGADTGRLADGEAVVRLYIAPFDDTRIEAFASNWYAQREAAATRAGADAAHLVRAVHADKAILRLARVPNLLTLMALIHRIEATLPHGRALLYERIGEAYLESIDKYRGVYSSAYNLAQKRRWLGRVGYEMQRRRSDHERGGELAGKSELLADEKDVVAWLGEEMGRASTSEKMSAGEFLDFVGKRSGLFLPRGGGRYAFVHLSFQEYFAAVALEREVTSVSWARGKRTQLGLDRECLAKWSSQSVWRETLAFLFELMADKEDWHAALLETVFGESFGEVETSQSEGAMRRAELLARVVVNPLSGIVGARAFDALEAAVRAALRNERTPTPDYPLGANGIPRIGGTRQC